MTNSRILLSALVVAAAACGGSDGPTAPEVVSVTVSPSTTTLTGAGATVQLSAQAKDGSGATVTGVPTTWTSSATDVATVSGSGLVTAVTPGTAAITATAGGVAGSAVITVDPVVAACEDPTTVALAPGQHQVFAATDCFILPAGSSGDRYRVVVTRPDSAGASSVADVSLNVTGLGVTAAPVQGAPGPARASAPLRGMDPASLGRAVRVAEATEAFHADLRRREAALVDEMLAGGPRLAASRPAGAPVRAAAAAAPAKIRIDTSTPSSCGAGAGPESTGVLVHESADLVVYQDSTQRAASPISVGNAQRMTTYFAAYAKNMIRSYFGAFSDVDGNGKIVVFVTPAATGNVAAFVWSGDFFTTESCPPSNEMELIYFNASVISAMDNEPNPNFQALETLAHEAKHVVSLYRRIAATQAAGASRFHPQWIEEGTAEIAGGMSSRIAWAATGGPAVGARVTRQDFQSSGVTRENYGTLLRMARTIAYLNSQPNGMVVSPSGADDGHSIYGTGWNFHRWLGDAYGNARSAQADSSLFRALNDSTAGQGTAGLNLQLGKTFRELFREFVVAVSLHGTGAPEGPRPFTSYEFVTATNILQNQPEGEYPWPVTTTSLGPSASFRTATYTGPIGPTGIRIHDFVSNGSGTGARIQADMQVVGEIVVVRLR